MGKGKGMEAMILPPAALKLRLKALIESLPGA